MRPLPTYKGYTYLLTAVDHFTRWPEALSLMDWHFAYVHIVQLLTSKVYTHLLTAVDHFTRWSEAVTLMDTSTSIFEKTFTYLCVVRLLLDSTTVLEGLFGEYHSSAALGKQGMCVNKQPPFGVRGQQQHPNVTGV